MGRFSSRAVENGEGAPRGGYGASGEDLRHWPTLVEFIALDHFEDGSARAPGTVMLFVEGGRLKACFNDKAEGRVAFQVFDSLETILGELDKALASDDLDWRRSKAFRLSR